jgi:ankyrin repeat protein
MKVRRCRTTTAHLILRVGGLLLGGLLSEQSAGAETDLYRAVEEGHLSVVEAAIADGFEVDIPDGQGRTPIWHAASKGRVRVVTALAAYGAMLDGVDRFGVSPLTVAIRRGHVDVVRSLLRSGASPDPVDDVRFVPLHVAVEQDAQDIVDLLLSAGADPLVQYKTGDPSTDLTRHTMIRLRLRGMLMGRIAYLNVAGGLSALTFPIETSAETATLAIVKGNDEVVYEQGLRGPIVPPSFELRWDGRKRSGDLVESGRYTFRLSLNGVTAEMDRRVVRVADISLFEASAFGTGDLVRAILARGEEVDQTGIYGRTPLMLAAAFANVETARVLMTSGASPFAADEEGRSSLDYARIYSPTHEILPMIQSYLDRLSID